MMRLTVLFLITCLTAGSLIDATNSYKKMKLTDVESLLFKPGMMTSASRSHAVPQLKCLRNCKHANDIDVVMCKNIGDDGLGNVNWECTAKPQLPDGVKLGDLEVVCEGYSHPDDPYILAGSCGLEYTLVGSATYGHGHRERSYDYGSHRSSKPYRSSSHDNDGWSWFTWLIIALVAYTVYRSCFASRHPSGMHMGGGGGGMGAGNPPPPPPYSQAASAPSPQSGFGSSTPGYSSSTPGYAGAASSSGPGFWSGMAGGGLMGYMLGNRHNNAYGYGYNNYMQPPQHSFFGSSYGSGYGSGFGSSSGYSSPSPSRSSAGDSTSYATTRRR